MATDGFPLESSDRGLKLHTYLYLIPRVRMNGAVPPLHHTHLWHRREWNAGTTWLPLLFLQLLWLAGPHSRGGGGSCLAGAPPNPTRPKFKNTDFVDIVSKFYVIYPSAEISHWNRLMTSTLEFWIINRIKKKQDGRTLWLSHGTCSYICVYINAVSNSVMLYLRHDCYNIIFIIKYKLLIASGSVPLPNEKFWVRTWWLVRIAECAFCKPWMV
jgi:hypothetical protein